MDPYNMVHFILYFTFFIVFSSFINEFMITEDLAGIANFGTVFGVAIDPDEAGEKTLKKRTRTIVLGVFSSILFFAGIGSFLSLIFENILLFAAYLLLFLVVFLLVSLSKYNAIKKFTAKQTNALVLGELPLIQDIDAQIARADAFIVDYYKVTITTNGVEKKIYYFEYGYDELNDENEIAMLGMYMWQRHHKSFKIKVKMQIKEVLTGNIIGTVTNSGFRKQIRFQEETELKRVVDSYHFSRR